MVCLFPVPTPAPVGTGCHRCHIVAMQAPDGRGPLPAPLVALLRSSRSAVLLYRSPVNAGTSSLAPQASSMGDAATADS